MLYRMLKRLLERGQTEGMADKLDVFYAAGKISKKEYQKLTKLLNSEATG